jgi:hypothetical protein
MTEATKQVKLRESVYQKLREREGKDFNEKVLILLGVKTDADSFKKMVYDHDDRIRKLEHELEKARGY